MDPAKLMEDIHPQATSAEKVVTEQVNGRLIAHVYGYEGDVDISSALALKARTAVADWDAHKPTFRGMARRVIDAIESKGIHIRAVLFQSEKEKPIEVCPSDKMKTLSDDLVNETKFRNQDHLMREVTEVTLKGALAQWAVTNLPLMTKPEILKENLIATKKFYLTEAFRDLYKQAMIDPEVSEDVKTYFRRLNEGGFNLPAVEVKK